MGVRWRPVTGGGACDVVVVGLGGMGSAAAWHLARRGARVVGLERFGPAHDRGSSHGGSRVVRTAYFEDPRYVPLLHASVAGWEELGRRTGAPVLVRTGGLVVGPADGPVVTGTRASAERWGLDHAVLDPDAARALFPTLSLADHELAVHEPAAGFVRPEAVVRSHLELAAGAGADLRFDTAVTGWAPEGTGVVVRTGDGDVRAGHLVVTAGPWADRLCADLGVPLVVERHVVHWFTPAGDPSRWSADRHPVWIWELAPGHEAYGIPSVPGGPGAKAAYFHAGRPTDPDAVDRGVDESEAGPLRADLDRRLPGLCGTWRGGSACLYTVTPDHHFVLGPLPGADGRASVAAGFSGHGFKFVPVVGTVLADLALDGGTAADLSLFDPTRFDGG